MLYIVLCWWISSVSLCVCFRLRCSLWIVWKKSCLVFPLSSLRICFVVYVSSIASAQGRSSPASGPAPPLLHFPWPVVEHGEGRSAFLGYSRTYLCAVQAVVVETNWFYPV